MFNNVSYIRYYGCQFTRDLENRTNAKNILLSFASTRRLRALEAPATRAFNLSFLEILLMRQRTALYKEFKRLMKRANFKESR